LILDAAQYNLGLLPEALISLNKGLESLGQSNSDQISQYYKIYTLANLACENIYLGNFIEAEKIYKKIKNDIEQLYANHPRKAFVYVDLATLMYHLGNFNEAISFLEQSLKIKLAHSSLLHPENADIQLILGFNNYKLGKLAAAKNNFNNAVTIYKLYNGEDFVYIFSDMGLWLVHEALGEYEKAINYMQATLAKAKSRYQDNINSIMSFQLTQADFWPTSISDHNIYYWQLALKTSEKLFGTDNYQSARYHYIVGLVMEHAKRKTEAVTHYKRALAILSMQKIRHPLLKKFYLANIKKVTIKIQNI
jgi:tetratricopeptide (TPR) repeat protein